MRPGPVMAGPTPNAARTLTGPASFRVAPTMFKLLRNAKFRDWAAQALFLGAVVGVVVFFVLTASANMRAQGITAGYGFLFQSTGWDINFSLLPYTPNDPYWKVLAIGMVNTLFLGSISLALATIVGMVVAAARTSRNPMLNTIGTIYVDTFRNVPILLQVFFWYAIYTRLPPPRQAYSIFDTVFLSARGLFIPALDVSGIASVGACLAIAAGLVAALWIAHARRFARKEPVTRRIAWLAVLGLSFAIALLVLFMGRGEGSGLISVPELKGLNFRGGIAIPPEFAALATSIMIYGGTYIAEVLRAGFLAVSRGQVEAATALGLRPWEVFSRIRLPLAIRMVLPTLINQYVWLLKATTLGIAVGFTDYFMVIAVSITQSGHTIELIALLIVGFLVVNYSLSTILNRINRAIAIKGLQSTT